MSAARGMRALGGTPAENAVQAVVALTAAPHLGLLDAKETTRAGAVLANLLTAAMGAGFIDGDLLQLLAAALDRPNRGAGRRDRRAHRWPR